jgi:hypothetical protein
VDERWRLRDYIDEDNDILRGSGEYAIIAFVSIAEQCVKAAGALAEAAVLETASEGQDSPSNDLQTQDQQRDRRRPKSHDGR